MYNRFSVYGNWTTGTNKTGVGVTGGPTARPAIYEFNLGSNATPADVATQFTIKRSTAAGTSTAYTPNPLDSGDRAAVSTAGITHSGEPTYTANSELWFASLNQRATYRWVAAPNSELIAPATSANGLGLKSVASGGTPTYDGHVLFFE